MNENCKSSSMQASGETDQYGIPWVSLDGYGHLGNTCSSMDCTGLIPALPASEAELEAYEEMYQFCAQKPAPLVTEPEG